MSDYLEDERRRYEERIPLGGCVYSSDIFMEKLTDQFVPHFELESFRVVVEKDKERPCYSHAMIKIRVDDKTEITSVI